MSSQAKKQTKLSFLTLVATSMLTFSGIIQADGQRIQWHKNQHYYQRFDQKVSWGTADAYCQSLSAHLVTITSDIERNFVQNIISHHTAYWIGAHDRDIEGHLKWDNNEKWNYSHLHHQTGINGEQQDYLYQPQLPGDGWKLAPATQMTNFICEWSSNNYIDIDPVPDLNSNEQPEVAALYVDYKTSRFTVKVTDPKTKQLISTLYYSNSLQPPLGMVVLKDINNNTEPEIGVLHTDYGYPSVFIKDIRNNAKYIKIIHFMDKSYLPKAVSVSPDINGNGYDEVTVLGVHKSTNIPIIQTRDSKTGQLLLNTML